jgi:hypothetical protein
VKAVDGILSEDFDFALLTVEEQAEFIELMEQVIGDEWTLTSKQAFAEALWGKVDWMLPVTTSTGCRWPFPAICRCSSAKRSPSFAVR